MLGSAKGKQEVKKDISSPETPNKTENAQDQETIFMMRGSAKGKQEGSQDISSPVNP
jgi:hypothetical protein